MVVEVDVSQRCEHDCFVIELGSDSQWHLPGAGTFSSERGELWVFHGTECRGPDHAPGEDEECPCDCFLED